MKPYGNFDTLLLINKCIERDPLAWAEFIRRFSPLIRFAIKKALSKYASHQAEEDLKDIEQNIMTSLWGKKRLADIKNKGNINYWLVITARNAAINHIKARSKEVLISDNAYFEKFPSPEPEEKRIDIKKIYESLKVKEQIMFRLYFEKELSFKDISKIMDMPLGTVSSLITRIRKKICGG